MGILNRSLRVDRRLAGDLSERLDSVRRADLTLMRLYGDQARISAL